MTPLDQEFVSARIGRRHRLIADGALRGAGDAERHTIDPAELAHPGLLVPAEYGAIRIADSRTGPDHFKAVAALRYGGDDTIQSFWGFYHQPVGTGVSLVLMAPENPSRVIGQASLEFEDLKGPTVAITLNTVFIDAGYRGAGYGRCLAAAVCALIGRVRDRVEALGDPEDADLAWEIQSDVEGSGGRRILTLVEQAFCADDEARWEAREAAEEEDLAP